jgi:hypothetical protein
MVPQMGSLGISPTVGSFGQDPTALGISADPSRFAGSTKGTLADPLEKQDFISVPAKKTFADSVSTALKGVGNFVKSGGFTGGLFRGISKQRNESPQAIALNRSKFNIVTSPGSMQGRIVGDRGDYNPSENLFHGMNRDSALGNLENAGQKRIDRRNSASTQRRIKQTMTREQQEKFNKDTRNMEKELGGYKQEKKQAPVTGTTKPGTSGGADRGGGRSKIVCTMMNESYGFGSFRNKIWLRHSKNLAPEYQRGYHKLFLPLVKKAKTNKILKKILEHIAIHRTIDIRQEERNKIHLLGRVYRTILEPICYWAGKK